MVIVLNDKIIEILKIVILVMLFTAALFPLVKWISHHVNALDYPNERKVHKKPMPLMGGLMMFFGFLFGYMLYRNPDDYAVYVCLARFTAFNRLAAFLDRPQTELTNLA